MSNHYLNMRQNQSFIFAKLMQDKHSKPHFYQPLRCIMNNLENFIDETNCEFSLQQAFSAAEAACDDGKSDWFCLSLFLCNLGKIMYLYEEDNKGCGKNTQWAITGETFLTGCEIPEKIIYPEYNKYNVDNYRKIRETYKRNCGLKNTIVSFSSNEYMYQVLSYNDNVHLLPPEALYLIRYQNLRVHWEHESYEYVLDEYDKAMLPLLKEFNKYMGVKKEVDMEKVKIKYNTLWKMFFQNFGLYL